MCNKRGAILVAFPTVDVGVSWLAACRAPAQNARLEMKPFLCLVRSSRRTGGAMSGLIVHILKIWGSSSEVGVHCMCDLAISISAMLVGDILHDEVLAVRCACQVHSRHRISLMAISQRRKALHQTSSSDCTRALPDHNASVIKLEERLTTFGSLTTKALSSFLNIYIYPPY